MFFTMFTVKHCLGGEVSDLPEVGSAVIVGEERSERRSGHPAVFVRAFHTFVLNGNKYR